MSMDLQAFAKISSQKILTTDFVVAVKMGPQNQTYKPPSEFKVNNTLLTSISHIGIYFTGYMKRKGTYIEG